MIKSLEELTKFLKICRKQGVMSITCDGLSVTLGELPKKGVQDDEPEDDPIKSFDQMTPEEQMLYSVGGMKE
jgi:hypothetical protein